jgi:hypothetical protein
MPSSAIWRRVGPFRTGISEALETVARYCLSCPSLANSFHPEVEGDTFPRNVGSKKTHCATSQKRAFFTITAVKNSNLTRHSVSDEPGICKKVRHLKAGVHSVLARLRRVDMDTVADRWPAAWELYKCRYYTILHASKPKMEAPSTSDKYELRARATRRNNTSTE